MDPSGTYSHPIGTLSKGAVLDVGLKCTHSCKFCYYSFLDGSDDQFLGMRKVPFRTPEECKEILRRLNENGFTHFDYTGGEPTLHPDIIEIARYAHREMGLKGRMITLGQFLMRKMPKCKHDRQIDDLLEAGLTNFLFSVHAVEEELFHKITGESYEKLRQAMTYLDDKGFHYTTNTVVFDWNFCHLPALAQQLTKHAVYQHNFILMNAYYEWNAEGRAFGVQAKYSDVFPYLKQAVDILESKKIATNIRYAPLCTVKGFERNLVGMIGVRYDPYEWMNNGGHTGGDPEFCAARIPLDEGDVEEHLSFKPIRFSYENGVVIAGVRGNNLKYFADACTTCRAIDLCDGIDPNYLKLYGSEEFRPYDSPLGRSPLPDARRQYDAAFLVKTEQYADMKEAVREAFEQGQAIGARGEVELRRPKVSIVITCYNYGRYIAEAIESVLAQTCRDYELIVVNDGSTDNTEEVAQKYKAANPDRTIRVISQSRSGQPAISRNRGITESSGEYVLVLDADDKLAPTMLEESLKALDDNAQADFVYTDRSDFGALSQVVRAREYDFEQLRYENHVSYCALFRRRVWEDVGGYRLNVPGCEDWDFWVAAGVKGHFGYYLAKPLFQYRRHEGGLFQHHALGRLDEIKAQIVMNNKEAYTEQDVTNAARLLEEKSKVRFGESAPLVSVIVPTYNRPEMLKRAVESIASQTLQDVEIIIVNDGGLDVDQVLSGLNRNRNIVYVKHARNRGVAAARNSGLKLARGKFVAYLDDDDLFYPDHLETLVNFLETSGSKVAYTDAYRARFGETAEHLARSGDLRYSSDFDQDQILVHNFIPTLCLVHERSILDEVGGFDESLQVYEDWDLWIRLSGKFKFHHIQKVSCEYSWHLEGRSLQTGTQSDLSWLLQIVYEKNKGFAKGKPQVLESQRKRLQAERSYQKQAMRIGGLSISFERGFYQDEGGWRWMSDQGWMVLGTGPAPLTGLICFDIGSGTSDCYEHFPFDVYFVHGEKLLRRFRLASDRDTERVFVPISLGPGETMNLRLTSEESYVPSSRGINNDIRRLSIRLSNPVLWRGWSAYWVHQIRQKIEF
jgi:glycosyltransferase involved in cell wall biosynthesis/MoaA/NifB/PqqE/SkfB family radical SAM enzyme